MLQYACLILLLIGVSKGADDYCYTVNCESLPNKCAEKNELDYTILISDQCKEGTQICDVDTSYNGLCKAINYKVSENWRQDSTGMSQDLVMEAYTGITVKFPGDPCDETSYTEDCSYGKQKCTDGFCESVGHNGQCSQSKDCPSHQY